MLTAPELKALLRSRGLRLTKRRGQHHLVDAAVIERIVERCGLSPHDTVVEIGSGLGALTEPLARQAGRVTAVEADRGIASLLAERMRPLRNVTVVCEDILRFAWADVPGAVVVGAIPYELTSPILAALAESRRTIRKIVLILQEEVAQRLTAAPGTKAYGRLTLLGQYCWDITPLLAVPRRAFFPQPAVDSQCVQLLPKSTQAVRVAEERLFFGLVKRAFAHRRKTLVNCLCGPGGMPRAEAETLVAALGLPASVRGEALSLEQFAALANLVDAR
ncbi:MAG: ribosomal RNA small subunit methyltransferase A [Candidatus Omnitrophica bacterium]|nr:ribosomal RNA small subunit methyltransferase A [Candidatus Omnitrophota bacterium]